MHFFLSRAFTRSILLVAFVAGMLAMIASTHAEVGRQTPAQEAQ